MPLSERRVMEPNRDQDNGEPSAEPIGVERSMRSSATSPEYDDAHGREDVDARVLRG